MYALRTLHIPGTLAPGYFRGHEVPDPVVQSWGLVENEDVSADPPGDESAPVVVARPVDDSSRSEWLGYVIARGTDPDEAAQLPLDELMGLYPEQDAVAAERPAESAKKAEWIDYVIAQGGDAAWARSGDTTKADLVDWQPVPPAEAGTTDPAADQGNAASDA